MYGLLGPKVTPYPPTRQSLERTPLTHFRRGLHCPSTRNKFFRPDPVEPNPIQTGQLGVMGYSKNIHTYSRIAVHEP